MSTARLLAPLAFLTFGNATMAQSDTLAAPPMTEDYVLPGNEFAKMTAEQMSVLRGGRDADWIIAYYKMDSTLIAIKYMDDNQPIDRRGECVDWDKTDRINRIIWESQKALARKKPKLSNFKRSEIARLRGQKLNGGENRDLFRIYGIVPSLIHD